MASKIRLTAVCCFLITVASAQNTQPAPSANQPAPVQPSYAYKKLNPQLQYAFIVNKPGTKHPQEGDQVMLNMMSVYKNMILFNTRQQFKGKPGMYGVAKPAFKGDLIEAVMLMTPGDSIVCLVDADALYKNSPNKKPAFIKSGDKLQYFIKLVSIKPKEQVQKEQQAAFMKMMKEQEAKQKAAAAKQMVKDDKTLTAYFARQHISPTKTSSGLYYVIQQEGNGEKPLPGDSITMNYTGRLLDGTVFDSNVDTAFHHVQPFQFVLGRGMVIKGWDEGVALLKQGSKATFYIPSPLAYGAQARPGSGANPKGIPANSILLFDVDLLGSKHPAPAPEMKKVPEAKGDTLQPSPLKTDTLEVPVKPN